MKYTFPCPRSEMHKNIGTMVKQMQPHHTEPQPPLPNPNLAKFYQHASLILTTFTCCKCTTWDPWLYFPSEKVVLQICIILHQLLPGLNPQTLGPMAGMLPLAHQGRNFHNFRIYPHIFTNDTYDQATMMIRHLRFVKACQKCFKSRQVKPNVEHWIMQRQGVKIKLTIILLPYFQHTSQDQ
jgi:hypothetical protein